MNNWGCAAIAAPRNCALPIGGGSPNCIRIAGDRGAAEDRLAEARLQELTAAYVAATGFQRRFGRLPGARAVHAPAAARVLHDAAPPQAAAGSGGRRWRIALGVAFLAAIGWLVLMGPDPAGDRTLEPPSAPRASRMAPAEQPSIPAASEAPTQLQLGMAADAVRALEGPPLLATPERWDYGPSWIDFDRGKVSDWYSSPLRPLKVGGGRSG